MKLGKSTREAFGLALAEAGGKHTDIVVVDGDVHNSTRTDFFAKKFPDRFFNVGIAESNLVGVAAGLAGSGKRAWLSSFACFALILKSPTISFLQRVSSSGEAPLSNGSPTRLAPKVAGICSRREPSPRPASPASICPNADFW